MSPEEAYLRGQASQLMDEIDRVSSEVRRAMSSKKTSPSLSRYPVPYLRDVMAEQVCSAFRELSDRQIESVITFWWRMSPPADFKLQSLYVEVALTAFAITNRMPPFQFLMQLVIDRMSRKHKGFYVLDVALHRVAPIISCPDMKALVDAALAMKAPPAPVSNPTKVMEASGTPGL